MKREKAGSFPAQRFSWNALPAIAAWRELRFAKRAGRDAVARFQQLRNKRPELTGAALYQAFVCERNAIDESAARAILRRAEESFAAWPNDRDLIFRDVVQYLVISEYLASHPERGGTTVNMTRVIAKVIPAQF